MLVPRSFRQSFFRDETSFETCFTLVDASETLHELCSLMTALLAAADLGKSLELLLDMCDLEIELASSIVHLSNGSQKLFSVQRSHLMLSSRILQRGEVVVELLRIASSV